jgi:hypothetical protein
MVNEKVYIPTRGDLHDMTSDEDEFEAEKWNVQNQKLHKTNEHISI